MSGGSFIELMLAVFMLMLVVIPPGDGGRASADISYTTPRQLDSALQNASNAAATLPDGATVILKPDGALTTLIQTYENRPDEAQGSLIDQKTIPGPIALPSGDTTFALVIAHNGSVSIIDPYTTWSAAAAGSTACSSETLTFGVGSTSHTATMSCTTAGVTAN